MRSAPGDGYREIPAWPTLGGEREERQLALLAVDWIAMNCGFIQAQLPAEAGFDHRDVISQLLYRASKRDGLTRSLRAPSDGTMPIANPRGLLLRHMACDEDWCRILSLGTR